MEWELLLQARRHALQSERGALGDALRRGLLSDRMYDELSEDIDHRLEALELLESNIQQGWTRTEG